MKKTLKFLTIVIMATTVAVALSSCGSRTTEVQRSLQTPSEVAVDFFESFSTLDFDRLETLIYIPDDENGTEFLAELRDMINNAFSQGFDPIVSTEIIREEISQCGTQATVYAVVTHTSGFRQTDILHLVKINRQWKVDF